jgi:hypothetical protein
MQLSDVVLIYFVIGAVMVGGGAVDVGQAGIVNFFVEEDDGGNIEATGNATNQIDKTGGSISTVVSLAVGVALLVWNMATGLFAFIHWPLVALTQANAPPMAVLLFGGSFTAAFYMAVIGTVWRSA